jgi:glycosyltransferase involved in cell wall biosynthesis
MCKKQIPQSISEKVLTIGPDYHDHIGGMGSIIESYSSIFSPFYFIPSYRIYKNNLKKIIFFTKQLFLITKELIKNKKIKIIHIHAAHKGSFYRKFIITIIGKNIFHKKIVYHLHSSSFDIFYNNSGFIQKNLIHILMNKIDILICVSQSWKDFCLFHFKNTNIKIINNIVSFSSTNGNGATNHNYITNSSAIINFLFLGNIGGRKGIFDLIDVIKEGKDIFQGKIKLFVGGEGEVEKLKEIISSAKLEALIEYIGWVREEKKLSYFAASHVFVLPSYHEGLPVAILESMSHGLPIISTNVGGIPELVQTGINGIIFKPGDKVGLKNAMGFFVDHPEKIHEYGISSLDKIKQHFPEVVIQQLTDIYNELLV